MSETIRITAKIQLFAGAKMRQTPFGKGYRPLFEFHNTKTKISDQINLLDSELFYPGMSGEVEISFNKGIILDTHFVAGTRFTFGEGTFALGEGEILGRK